MYASVDITLVFNGTRFSDIFSLVNVILMLILCLSHFSNVKRQCCPNIAELMLSQLTYTTEFLLLFNIDNQRHNKIGQMFSAQWAGPLGDLLQNNATTLKSDVHPHQKHVSKVKLLTCSSTCRFCSCMIYIHNTPCSFHYFSVI